MSKSDYKMKIVEYAKSVKPRSTGHKLNSQNAFLDGVVAEVTYKDGETSEEKQWFIVTSKYSGYAETESQLIQQMNTASSKFSNGFNWLNQIANIGGIIALVLVVTVSYLSIRNQQQDIPEYLKASLFTILGFYFGGYIHKSRRRERIENG